MLSLLLRLGPQIEQSSSHVSLRWQRPISNGAPITSYNVEVTGFKNISFDVIDNEEREEEEEDGEGSREMQEYSIEGLRPSTAYRYGPGSNERWPRTTVKTNQQWIG